MNTYSLAEVRNGTGWPRGVRFVAADSLTSAAPSMLHALKEVQKWAKLTGGWEAECWTLVRKAIGDAEGWHKCQNCDGQWLESELRLEIPHYHERVAPDEPEPSGECPECGALCHHVE